MATKTYRNAAYFTEQELSDKALCLAKEAYGYRLVFARCGSRWFRRSQRSTEREIMQIANSLIERTNN